MFFPFHFHNKAMFFSLSSGSAFGPEYPVCICQESIIVKINEIIWIAEQKRHRYINLGAFVLGVGDGFWLFVGVFAFPVNLPRTF